MPADHKVASNPHHSTSAQPAHRSPTGRSVRAEIASCIPLLRVAAHVRTHNGLEADALVEATLRTAVARIDECSAKISVRAWLLGIQRAVFNPRQVGDSGAAELSSKEAGDGPEESYDNLHAALLQLPDHLREPLVLRDGAQWTTAEIAEILACDAETAERRVEEASCRLQELCETKSEFGNSEPKSPGRDARQSDFKVFKPDSSGWEVQAISTRARDFLQRHLTLKGEEPRRGAFFTDRRGASDFILYARTHGYMTDLVGPRDPLRG